MKSPPSSAVELFAVWVTFNPRVEYAVRVSVAIKKVESGNTVFIQSEAKQRMQSVNVACIFDVQHNCHLFDICIIVSCIYAIFYFSLITSLNSALGTTLKTP